ncbi:uncharacterized protein [Macrobrachium rosenbergii]|uniref:uncharacterized protein n=1 Tax=Macrobrachium rosenbergii TaxID=79674 RepID=UPI0034D70367
MLLLLVSSALWLAEALPSSAGDEGLDAWNEGLPDADGTVGQDNRKDKFIALLQISPYECTTTDGLTGTCFPSASCKISGVSSGSCAKGFGTCCQIQKTCDTTSSFDNTYFVNPSYPNSDTDSGVCMISIYRASKDICQMRLDFYNLELAQPDSDGNCNTDFLTVSGGTSAAPTICGTNSDNTIAAPARLLTSITGFGSSKENSYGKGVCIHSRSSFQELTRANVAELQRSENH